MSKPFFQKRIVILQCICMLAVSWFTGEMYFTFFASDKVITPAELSRRSLQMEPAVFAQHVFARKEQLYTDNQWGIKGKGYFKRYINEHGYRGKNFSIQKPQGITRIIFYGGSHVFDMFSNLNEDWPHLVENELHHKGNTDIEIINAGIPGHKSIDSLGRLITEGHHFQADYVILCNSYNDFKYFASNEPLLREMVPYTKKSNPMLNYHGKFDKFLSDHSYVYTFIRQEYYQRTFDVGTEGAKRQKHKYYYATNISQKGLNQFKLNVELFVDAARNIGATPILMTQARFLTNENMNSKTPKLTPLKKIFNSNEFVAKSFDAADIVIRNVASSKNALLIDASKEFSGNEELFVDHIHLSQKGSVQLAAFVSEYLKNELTYKNTIF